MFVPQNSKDKPNTIHGKPKHKAVFEEAKSSVQKPKKSTHERKKHDRKTSKGKYLGEKGKIAPRGDKQCWKCLRTVGEKEVLKPCKVSQLTGIKNQNHVREPIKNV